MTLPRSESFRLHLLRVPGLPRPAPLAQFPLWANHRSNRAVLSVLQGLLETARARRLTPLDALTRVLVQSFATIFCREEAEHALRHRCFGHSNGPHVCNGSLPRRRQARRPLKASRLPPRRQTLPAKEAKPVHPIPARSRQASIPDLVDLGAYYTASLDDDWLVKPGANLASLPKGVQGFARAGFDVRGLVQLAGKTAEKETGIAFPEVDHRHQDRRQGPHAPFPPGRIVERGCGHEDRRIRAALCRRQDRHGADRLRPQRRGLVDQRGQPGADGRPDRLDGRERGVAQDSGTRFSSTPTR